MGSAAAVALSKPALTAATPAWTCVWWQRWAAAEALGFSQEFPRRRFAACPPRSPSGLDRRRTARPFAVPRQIFVLLNLVRLSPGNPSMRPRRAKWRSAVSAEGVALPMRQFSSLYEGWVMASQSGEASRNHTKVLLSAAPSRQIPRQCAALRCLLCRVTRTL